MRAVATYEVAKVDRKKIEAELVNTDTRAKHFSVVGSR